MVLEIELDPGGLDGEGKKKMPLMEEGRREVRKGGDIVAMMTLTMGGGTVRWILVLGGWWWIKKVKRKILIWIINGVNAGKIRSMLE